MAWQITFPRQQGNPTFEAGETASRTVICRIEDGDEARRAAELLIGPSYSEWPIVAKEISDDAVASLGIEAGECREFRSE